MHKSGLTLVFKKQASNTDNINNTVELKRDSYSFILQGFVKQARTFTPPVSRCVNWKSEHLPQLKRDMGAEETLH